MRACWSIMLIVLRVRSPRLLIIPFVSRWYIPVLGQHQGNSVSGDVLTAASGCIHWKDLC